MNILFLTHRPSTPSVKWRVLQYIPYFMEAGNECTVESLSRNVFSKYALLKKSKHYDIVILQKRLLSTYLISILRSHSPKLIFEYDDAITITRKKGIPEESKERRRRFDYITQNADGIVTTNAYLASLLNENIQPSKVALIPNSMNVNSWIPRATYESDETLIVGWQGSASNLKYINVLHESLLNLKGRGFLFKLKIVSDRAFALDGVDVEHIPYTEEHEAKDVASFDIGIAPLVDDIWTRGKQSVKILCYFAAGVPVIASSSGASSDYVTHGRNGFLASHAAEWTEHLEHLMTSASLRSQIGQQGRHDVENRFSTERVAQTYLAFLNNI